MASSQNDIRDRVRTITDYDSQIINNNELDEVIDAAEDEIRSDLDDAALSFYQGDDTFDLDLAVMWLSCLFAKIKTGEIEGPTISLAEVRAAPRAAGSAIWLERYERAIHRYSDFRGYAKTEIARDTREYGESF